MVSISVQSTQLIIHRKNIGGVTLATITYKKGFSKEFGELNAMQPEELGYTLQKKFSRPVKGIMCHGCISCSRNKCFFAFPKYPNCYLPKEDEGC